VRGLWENVGREGGMEGKKGLEKDRRKIFEKRKWWGNEREREHRRGGGQISRTVLLYIFACFQL
jgi:hypothetical protein